ncbi:cyclic nucleotide-binding domain-containing protein [Thermospira aquatica]|uniref:Cyclic nucleotide-binding domain-containing protein n=1 Tax=Thermospira aquatica TaxID=2828656 RepID=A0AAX3BD13_9SPIR|nr:cyclic nucleotide-binding domain-containing protein [Thermospira aquatica]URA10114.1 cyclic nucleotide-binding domain-containing protein [Thermospira aquatica]
MVPSKHFQAGEYIIREDDTDKTMYIIIEGKVRVETKDPASQQPIVLTELGPKDFFGEIALLLNQPRNASVIAITPVNVYPISSLDMLADYLEIHPQFALKMIMIMAKRVDQMKDAYLKTYGHLQYVKELLNVMQEE